MSLSELLVDCSLIGFARTTQGNALVCRLASSATSRKMTAFDAWEVAGFTGKLSSDEEDISRGLKLCEEPMERW